ncbi:MAG TPA: hypothetical protein VFK06_21315 [Candidatus Angelobacter sp.]|nr:hypothetical protein [Candidatus Angelobacter sp.]
MKGPLRQAASGTLLWLLLALCFTATQIAGAQVNGAIFTTFQDGTTVNGNIYPAKDKVFISGGPQNEHARGLSPDGVYFFQVTDPSGAVLLSTDDISCRQVVVSGGRIIGVPAGPVPASCTEPTGSATPGAFHSLGTSDPNSGQTPVQLCAPGGCPAGSPDFKDTPDAGGEYKVWVTPVAKFKECCAKGHSTFGFCDSDSKTDNFKVKAPAMATISVCKFNDQNDNGTQDAGEPLIPHWPLTATGVVGDKGNGLATQTDDSGCVSFSVANFTNGSATVTLQEGTLGPDWTRTAPGDGVCTLSGSSVSSGDSCSITGGVITLTVTPGDDISAPNFGNFNPNCTTGCTGQQLLVTKTAHPVVTNTWTAQKSVDNSVIDTSGSAVANYTVTLSHAGTATMTGNIRISNPFGPDLSGITVSDVVSDATADGVSCTVGTPSDITADDGTISVVAGSHADATYSCTFTNVPAAGVNTNTATATWAAGTASGLADFDFSQATIVDGSVTVTDTLQGALGTVSVDAAGNVTTTANSPVTSSGPGIFNYALTFNDPVGTCTTHNNTASFTTNTSGATGSASRSVKVCVGADLTVSKSATPAFTSGIQKTVDKTLVDTASGSNAVFNYTVTVTESGWKVSGNITVTNPNDWEPITASVSDLLSDSVGSCIVNNGSNVITVAAASSQAVPYSCSFASAPAAAGVNTGTVTWDKAAAFTTNRSASGTAPYTFGSLTITDSFNGALGTVSSPAASTVFTYPRTIVAPIGTCATFPNTATIVETSQTASQSVKVCGASDLTVTKTANAAFNSNITKTVDNAQLNTFSGGNVTFNYTVTVTESGWNVSGNITASNPNDWENITANFADLLSGGNCTITDGTGVVVPASGSATRAYNCTFASAPGVNGVNSATATWDPAAAFTADSSSTGTAAYAFGSLTVTDSFKGSLGTISAPAASTTFTYPRTITAPTATCSTFPNTATIIETNQTASQSVKACGASDLAVTKTAAATFDSSIVKNVDKTLAEQAGGTATFTYTIQVTESGWKVAGNITVANPNDWEAISASVGDALSISGGACTISGGPGVTVGASSSVSLPYVCTFSAAPAAGGINTATASWNKAAFFTPDASSSGSAGFAFGALTTLDAFNGAAPVTLGVISAPAASTTFTDIHTVNNTTGGACQSFTNVATLSPTNQTSSRTVTVCNTATGALTRGFWQNKNGQNIIAGGASTGGICNSGAFLRTLNPFQDLSATATCSQVAAYVSNIIAGSNASGSSMNAQLKAQMLSTALDVFFSDPALGGNLIGASTPLGAVKIDLTQVCAMIDGSGGSSCSGIRNDVSSLSFGGNRSLTVAGILVFAANQSNADGSIWYGQNKTVQEGAKNAFDEINNQAAFIAP